jgi:hypothetical protein
VNSKVERLAEFLYENFDGSFSRPWEEIKTNEGTEYVYRHWTVTAKAILPELEEIVLAKE